MSRGPSIVDILIAGLAAFGFVSMMGLIAFAVEPFYEESRKKLIWKMKNLRFPRPRGKIVPGERDYLGELPETWRRNAR